MRAMVVEVAPEIEQLVFEIASRPEQQVIQILSAKGVPFCGDPRYVVQKPARPIRLSAPRPLRNISCFGLLYSRDGYSIPNFGGRKCLISFFDPGRWCSAASAAHSCESAWSICSIALTKVTASKPAKPWSEDKDL